MTTLKRYEVSRRQVKVTAGWRWLVWDAAEHRWLPGDGHESQLDAAAHANALNESSGER